MADQPESDFDFEAELAGMDDIQTGSALLPEEAFTWVVKSARSTVSKNGTNGIKLNIEITEGPYRGKSMIHDVWYSNKSPAAIEFFWRQMRALGITSAWARQPGNSSMRAMAAACVGVVLTAKIKHEEYMEEARARTQLSKIVGTNPNISDGGTALTGVAQPPAGPAQLPDVPDDDDTDAAPVGAASVADPWGKAGQ